MQHFLSFRRRNYPRIYLADRHHHLRRYRHCRRCLVYHLRDTYQKWIKKCSNKVKYISLFVGSETRATRPKGLAFKFFRVLVPTYSL